MQTLPKSTHRASNIEAQQEMRSVWSHVLSPMSEFIYTIKDNSDVDEGVL